MKKQKLIDNIAYYFVIGVCIAILYAINQYTEGGSFYRNAGGLSFELIGFLIMLLSSWESKVNHPKTWRLGIILVSFGLLLQLAEVICIQAPSHCN